MASGAGLREPSFVPGAASLQVEEVAATSDFESVLFEAGSGERDGRPAGPDELRDLHLAEIIAAVTAGRDEHDLASLFATPVRAATTVAYRHEVFRDLEAPGVVSILERFAGEMQVVRRRLAGSRNVHHRYEQERWLLDAAFAYADAVTALCDGLSSAGVRSRGLAGFRDFLAGYVAADAFTALVADAERVENLLAAVRYRLRLETGRVTVTRYEPEPDYGAEVLAHFEKFRQGDTTPYDFGLDRQTSMNHVEAAILDGVALQHPDVFAALDTFCETHRGFLDPTIARFDREIQFYLGYLAHIAWVGRAGLPFCYPEIVRGGGVECRGLFDLALAASLIGRGEAVVPNDLELRASERVVVVSGPNQGGKTTFARAVGQLLHLARIGVPVPGSSARLPLVDAIHTHFERQEQVDDLNSKLEGDLRRIHAMLEQATPGSLLILNESFSSTTVTDQLSIGRKVMARILELGVLCVVVTFLDELASLDPAVVSLVSTVDPADPARRTYEIVRRPADGLAYALAIADKHRLTYPSLKARLAR
jgi:DNA mismatch repair protein MutS